MLIVMPKNVIGVTLQGHASITQKEYVRGHIEVAWMIVLVEKPEWLVTMWETMNIGMKGQLDFSSKCTTSPRIGGGN